MGISRATVERVKQVADIYAVVSPAVALKRAGRNWVGLSPFSQEKTPSFNVLPDKGIFKCFSSGLGGDAIRFVMLHDKLTFPEAVEQLAQKFHVPIEYEGGGGPSAEDKSLRQELLQIHEYAADCFHRAFLAEDEAGRAIRAYWTEQRKFPLDAARDYRVGFSAPGGGGLLELLLKKGFSAAALAQCGLFYAREGAPNPRTLRPRFRGRLMIPIREHYQGQIVAFTARKTGLTPADDPTIQAKYVNSPETPLFHKSALVFGLERAREAVKATGAFLLVEGQLDCIRCHLHGFGHAVAPQGTSVTDGQLALLKRYAGRVDCLLDGDSAGQRAALRLLPLAWKAELALRFLSLPPGADPDSLLSAQGAPGLQAVVERAEEALPFVLRSLLPDPVRREPARRAEALGQFFEMLRAHPSATARDGYLSEAARALGIDLGALRRDFAAGERPARPTPPPPTGPSPAPAPAAVLDPGRPATTVLRILLAQPELTPAAAALLDPDLVTGRDLAARMLRRGLAALAEGEVEDLRGLREMLDGEAEQNAFFHLLAEEADPERGPRQLARAVAEILDAGLRARGEALLNRMAALPYDSAELGPLLREHRALAQERMRLIEAVEPRFLQPLA